MDLLEAPTSLEVAIFQDIYKLKKQAKSMSDSDLFVTCLQIMTKIDQEYEIQRLVLKRAEKEAFNQAERDKLETIYVLSQTSRGYGSGTSPL